MYRAVPVSPVESTYTLGLLGSVAISPTRLRKMSTLGEVAPLQLRRTVFIPPTLDCCALSWSCPGVAVGVAVGVGVGVPPPTGSASVNNVAGLPGPGRVTIRGTATGLP